MKISEFEEAELRVGVENMYAIGGMDTVLTCVNEMQQYMIIILTKLNEILEAENKKGNI